MPNSSGLEFYIFLAPCYNNRSYFLSLWRVVKYRDFALQEKNVVGLFCIVNHFQWAWVKMCI